MRARDLSLAALSGVLLTAAQRPVDLSHVAWVACVPLLIATADAPWRRRCLVGAVCGTVHAWSTVGYWLVGAFLRVPFDLADSLLLAQLIVTVGIVALAAFALSCGNWSRSRLSVLSLPAAWVAIEHARGHIPGSNPWSLIGHSQHAHPQVIQIADFAGVYVVSFVIVACNVAIASWWRGAAPRVGQLTCAALLIVASLGYGATRLNEHPAEAPALMVQVAHPAWSPELGEEASRRLDDLVGISETAPGDPRALLIWPENALRFFLQDGGELSDRVRAFVVDRRQYVVAGLHRYERRGGAAHYYNSAVLLAPEGSVVGVTDKRRLVPFAETRWRGLPAVQQPFDAGQEWLPLVAGDHRLGILMCFESIFPEAARALVANGATILINPTNDAILGPGAAQLAGMAVFRSIETRVPLVHAGTTGVTVIVDATGRVVAREDRWPRLLTAPLAARAARPLYARLGDGFVGLCWLVVIAQALCRSLRRRQRA